MKFQSYKVLTLAMLLSAFVSACNTDTDIIYTNGGDDLTLNGNSGDIVLDVNNLDALALTIYWNDNGTISTSDVRVAAPKYAVTNTVQFSATEDFASTVDFTMENGVYEKQFTHKELNNVLGRLGFDGGVKAPLYIRIKGVIANNMAPQYSNVMSMNVTPYVIDMTTGLVLSSSKEDTGKTLASPASDGIYTGFLGVTSWYNWYMLEGNSTIWGNEAANWTPFKMSSSVSTVDYGNFWFPGSEGCYYTVVNTKTSEWSALLLPTLSVSGDISGDLTYYRKENVWRLVFTGKKGSANIKISTTGKQYNVSTGTDDASAVSTPVGFGGTADKLTFGSTASNVSVAIPGDGECTLKLDLSNPFAWTVSVTSGSEGGEDTISEYLWMSGIDDGLPGGSWTFNNFLTLYNEDDLCYGGMANVNSLWGYLFYTEYENWGSAIGMADGGTALSGNLLVGGSNITAPDAGLYIMDVSLNKMTYKLFEVNSVSYTGLNDDWSVTAMTATETPGVYTASVVKSANTPWGVKILINESWDLYFGGGSGVLRLYHDGFDGDNELANGTYTLTVDLCKGTYSYK